MCKSKPDRFWTIDVKTSTQRWLQRLDATMRVREMSVVYIRKIEGATDIASSKILLRWKEIIICLSCDRAQMSGLLNNISKKGIYRSGKFDNDSIERSLDSENIHRCIGLFQTGVALTTGINCGGKRTATNWKFSLCGAECVTRLNFGSTVACKTVKTPNLRAKLKYVANFSAS